MTFAKSTSSAPQLTSMLNLPMQILGTASLVAITKRFSRTHPKRTKQAMFKDVRRGCNIVVDERLVLLIPHLHTTPVGTVDLDKTHKEPRPIFDSTFCVNPSSMAINDWVSPHNKPDIHFPKSFINFCIWIYNLRISYPHQEIYLIDDDVSGAFRHAKCNPNLVALHSCLLFGFLFVSTGGQTFGDSTSPANFEPIACARQQHAQCLWKQADTLLRAKPHMPTIQFQAPPTDSSVFFQSTADLLNMGVFNCDGTRRSPIHDHHVNDNVHGDVKEFVSLGGAASVLALYLVLGHPGPRNRDSVSWNKFNGFFTHERKMIGYGVNTRDMKLFLLEHKRTQLKTKACFDRSGGAARILAELETGLVKRFDSLVARGDVASLLWRSKKRFSITSPVRAELQHLHAHLSDFSNPWEVLIDHVVPRTPNYRSAGDASLTGGGAVNDTSGFWFNCRWSPRILRGAKLSPRHPDHVHINCLEFIVLLLQIVACIVCLDAPHDLTLLGLPANFPSVIPILLALTNNMSSKSWIHGVVTALPHSQTLIQIHAALLRRLSVGLQCEHLPGVLNVEPDFILHPNLCLPPHDWHTQMFRKVPRLQFYNCFLPSPELISETQLRLFSDSPLGLPELPSNLQEAAVKEIFNTQQGGWGLFCENKFKSHKIKYEHHNT
jgi:hypothetical protein